MNAICFVQRLSIGDDLIFSPFGSKVVKVKFLTYQIFFTAKEDRNIKIWSPYKYCLFYNKNDPWNLTPKFTLYLEKGILPDIKTLQNIYKIRIEDGITPHHFQQQQKKIHLKSFEYWTSQILYMVQRIALKGKHVFNSLQYICSWDMTTHTIQFDHPLACIWNLIFHKTYV